MMNDLIVKLMNKEYSEALDKELSKRIENRATQLMEIQQLYGKIDKEVVICRCYSDYEEELRNKGIPLSKVKSIVDNVFIKHYRLEAN